MRILLQFLVPRLNEAAIFLGATSAILDAFSAASTVSAPYSEVLLCQYYVPVSQGIYQKKVSLVF